MSILCVFGVFAVENAVDPLAGNEVLAAAVLDRLLHKCHVIDIKGRSYRLRELERIVRERR